jgi:cystathionine beta-lyase/cystathionine gamma-synthase
MVSAVIRGNNIGNFFKNLKLVKISQSFGGFGTIIQVPRKMINFSFSGKELDRLGITSNLIRISVGLEDVNDIIEDLNQALNKI